MVSSVDLTRKRIALNLQYERESRGWSLGDLAKRSTVSKATINRIEREVVNPSFVSIVLLAEAMGITLYDLLSGADSERSFSRADLSATPSGGRL